MKKFEAIEVFEHETAIFQGQYDVASGAKLEFYKENKTIKVDERIQIKEEKDGKFSLIINDCNADDEGKYKCSIKNDYGFDEDEASLVVKKRSAEPQFKEKLKDMEAKIGDENVKLAVKVDGEPKPNCKWYHNGEPIAQSDDKFKIVDSDNGSTLIIPKVEQDHQGTYVCKTENADGAAETASKLIIKCPPYVVKHLENTDSCIGMDVKLTAVIKGIPTPEAKWFCNDKEVLINDRKQYGYDEANAEYSLVIKRFQDEDTGEYKIEASNSYGKCMSAAQVQVASKPLFAKVLKNIAAKEMESNIEMVVQLNKESTKPLVKWFKDDEEIKDSNNKFKKIEDKLDNSYKLVILKATDEMVGKYKCVASNEHGSTETAARFDIITKPRFIKGLQDLEVVEGNNVSMTVQLAGCPQPEVTFYKDGEEISAEAHIQIKKEMNDIYQLEIENIRIIMSGEYECRIKNEAGEASSKGVVTVSSKPKFLKDLTDLNIATGDNILLEVVVTGNPSPKVTWFVNGQETAGSERILFDSKEESYCLKIPEAKQSDSGVYHCVATNKHGEQSSSKSNVVVNEKETAPVFTKRIQDAEVVIDDNVRFVTAVSASPKAKVSWTKDSVPLESGGNIIIKSQGDEHELIMKNLQKNDAGVIGCKAENVQGFTTQTANLYVEGKL